MATVYMMLAAAGVAGDHTWLYPILLPSTTDTLMTLYRAHCSVDDDKLAVTLRDLDEKLDNDLCELLEITRSYLTTVKPDNAKINQIYLPLQLQ